MEPELKNNDQVDLKRAKEYTRWDEFKQWIPSIIILPIALYWIFNRGEYGLLDNIDLVIHEAGHLFFRFFGKFIYTLGGTLMQIIIPSIIAGFFFRNDYRTGVQVALLWLGGAPAGFVTRRITNEPNENISGPIKYPTAVGPVLLGSKLSTPLGENGAVTPS